MMKKIFLAAALLAALCSPASADVVRVNPTGAVSSIGKQLAWGSAKAGGTDNIYIFSPLYTSGSVCFLVFNNNPTNPHPFNVIIGATANPDATQGTFAANQFAAIPTYGNTQGFTTFASTLSTVVMGAPFSGVSAISITVSGSGVLAGSPDTADFWLIQTQGNGCTAFASGGVTPQSNNMPMQTVAGMSNLFSNATGIQPIMVTSSNNLAQGSSFIEQALVTDKGPRWSVCSNVGGGVQASISKAAVPSVRHVADCLTYSAVSTGAVAATGAPQVLVLDGGTTLWAVNTAFPAAAGAGTQENGPFTACGLNLPGTPNTAMVIQYNASVAGAAEQVCLSGFDVQ